MCKTINTLNNLMNCTKEINERFEIVSEKISELDKAQNDLLHMIENENINASRGYELARAIKTIRIERREPKNEYGILLSISDQIKSINKTLENVSNRANKLDKKYKKICDMGNDSYSPRVLNITSDIRIEVENIISKEV